MSASNAVFRGSVPCSRMLSEMQMKSENDNIFWLGSCNRSWNGTIVIISVIQKNITEKNHDRLTTAREAPVPYVADYKRNDRTRKYTLAFVTTKSTFCYSIQRLEHDVIFQLFSCNWIKIMEKWN